LFVSFIILQAKELFMSASLFRHFFNLVKVIWDFIFKKLFSATAALLMLASLILNSFPAPNQSLYIARENGR